MILTQHYTQAHQPTTLERIQGLAALCSMAKHQLTEADPQAAWEALVDAQASLEAAAATIVQVRLTTDRHDKRSNGGKA